MTPVSSLTAGGSRQSWGLASAAALGASARLTLSQLRLRSPALRATRARLME
jgi:hypothetical protein